MVETSIIKYCSCSWPRDHEEVGTASFDHMKQGASPNEECLVQNKHHLLKKVKNKLKFVLGDDDDVLKRLIDALEAKKISFTLSKSGRKALFCRDPDGNAIEVIEKA